MSNKLKNMLVVVASLLVIVLILDTAKNELSNWLTDQFIQDQTVLSVKK